MREKIARMTLREAQAPSAAGEDRTDCGYLDRLTDEEITVPRRYAEAHGARLTGRSARAAQAAQAKRGVM